MLHVSASVPSPTPLLAVAPKLLLFLTGHSLICYYSNMGRPRSFNIQNVITIAADTFLRTGYEGTSIDDLVDATGVHRGSLYNAFGSKRGLFLLALEEVLGESKSQPEERALDLALVALLELAPRDPEIRDQIAAFVASLPSDPRLILGARLLARAKVSTV